MPAETRSRRRSELKLDPVLPTCAGKSARPKFGAIVAMKYLGQSCDRPGNIYLSFVEPSGLVIDGVKQAKSNGYTGWRFQRQMKARHHPRAKIDGDRQHRPPNGSAEFLVDDDYVDKGVINLPDGVGSIDHELPRARSCGVSISRSPRLRAAAIGIKSATRRCTVFLCGALKPSARQVSRIRPIKALNFGFSFLSQKPSICSAMTRSIFASIR